MRTQVIHKRRRRSDASLLHENGQLSTSLFRPLLCRVLPLFEQRVSVLGGVLRQLLVCGFLPLGVGHRLSARVRTFHEMVSHIRYTIRTGVDSPGERLKRSCNPRGLSRTVLPALHGWTSERFARDAATEISLARADIGAEVGVRLGCEEHRL